MGDRPLSELSDPTELIFAAIHAGEIEWVGKAIQRGAALDRGGKTTLNTPLCEAVSWGQTAIAEFLIKQGSDIDARPNSETPLMIAARNGDVQTMSMLINNRADVNCMDGFDNPVTRFAARAMRNPDAVWDLLLAPSTGVNPGVMPSDPIYGPILLVDALQQTLQGTWTPCDSDAIAALIRRGAHWKDKKFGGYKLLVHMLSEALPDTPTVNEMPAARDVRLAGVFKHLFEAGVSPFLPESDIDFENAYLYAQDLRNLYPAIARAFQEAGEALVAKFEPAADRFVTPDGTLTDMTVYCCIEHKLEEVLKRDRWKNPRDLLAAKHLLARALPKHWQEAYSAVLDVASAQRDGASGSPLLRYVRAPQSRDLG